MKKVKYYYNTHNMRFEKLTTPLRVRLLQVLGYIAASIVTGILIFAITFRYIDSPKEKLLRQQNDDLKQNYKVMDERIKQLQLQMDEIANRDNYVYRSIFESNPIPDSARVKEMEKKKEVLLVQSMGETELVTSMAAQLNNLSLRMAFQVKSFGAIENMVKNKEKLLAAIPSIQPISNRTLNRVSSGFGYRIDPVYKDRRLHPGLDFTAPIGTPIYAAADGVVKDAGFNTGGYGNRVVVNHGFGYETLYAHMVRIKARVGTRVKRGEVIGYVGSTGKSTGPHLHYEVHKNGTQLDPIYFFYNDLTPAQFDRILKLAAASNQSFD
ncbi:MAG TPA: M23 family metallopeptidase [Sediminibacterium sp.]|jgi:murein DD-endopeptidase MepM/ murein hydrolase activator NlpD|uniref:M23 family metallopeptidase n=1 Tax=Sediminibacterium sp. TaxID=1917865 RepID=UPI0008AB9AFB|nr:M23 family metallopeptidase [Sediminibacterium sp.]OHC86721.1 MAG: peptidase M23 [Sphingobacteriia bacterium RIFOXYC2_FULL_35_18]OHC88421.1 MAG: peptidase M23 [Sphingobacteriia bacterium RIFOXYD2_FULL_35_12]OYY07730.1 MAG: peptidase M23 [Sphingobacteriia bacterium 35-36-14]OYZ51664.1 MAG: peptidase M23 [Sphingobacteriia bacterium 24-36-13]OZA64906.1 MAG: peptidase M23 [Sphingobacteriia bacterium 39-36-14]